METLIALFMTGIVISAILGVYANQHKNWLVQEEVADIQQNARAVIGELTKQIRMAGYKLPLGLDGIEAHNTNPDTVVVTYSDNISNAPLSANMASSSAELQCDGQDVTFLHDGQLAYIFDPDSGGGEFFTITDVQASPPRLQHGIPLSKAYRTGAIVLSLQHIKYYVDQTDTLHPNLMMKLPGQGAAVYAEGVEDLQFRYTMKNGMVVDVPTVAFDIREVSISITARSSKPDPNLPGNPYRRRTFFSQVNLRNLSS